MKLILGSSSIYRKQCLEKLKLPFSCQSPNIDETALANETPQDLVKRLGEKKAVKIAESEPSALIISSDQVATFNGKIIGKPHTHENATQQLESFSGHCIVFYTSLCLLNSLTNHIQSEVIPYKVYFRELSQVEIENYLQTEKPYQCAGSFKSEALGISLFKKMVGDDPNTLIGLPLISLVKMLKNEGINPLDLQMNTSA